jgi:hypothetical protein
VVAAVKDITKLVDPSIGKCMIKAAQEVAAIAEETSAGAEEVTADKRTSDSHGKCRKVGNGT